MLSRAFDAAVSAVLVLLAFPLMVIIGVAIRCDSRGPAIFTQLRKGRGGTPFRMHKFRTLVVAGAADTATPEGDPRITRIGRWLRHVRLDELPQLLDVLLGRMALVRPRPEVPANLDAVAPAALRQLFAVRPGLTGPTQLEFIAEDLVLAESSDPVMTYRQIIVPAKVRSDLAWIPRRSFWRDLAVLVRTPLVLVSRRAWARSRDHVATLVNGNPADGNR